MTDLVWKFATCNIRDINVPTKQKNIVYWHREMGNLVSIVIETKLRSGCRPWIKDRFDGVQVFTSGLDTGFFGARVAIIMDVFLAQHVSKISEVPGQLLSIKLLFKKKLSVSILGLYVGISSVVQFFQAGDINSLIAKAVNKFFFIILGGDFNEDGSCKCASFKKCLNLGLVNSLVGSPAVKKPIWTNSRDIRKTIDYMLISLNLVNVIVNRDVLEVSEHFNTNHQSVSVSVGLDGLLDMQLNSLHKQVNKNQWKFDFKDVDESKWIDFKGVMLLNATMFSDKFAATAGFSDLDTMWNIFRKIMVLLANKVFKKKWFKNYNGVFTKESFKFHKLELLVSRLIKASQLTCHDKFILLLDVWGFLDDDNASVVRFFFLSGSLFDTIWSALSKVKKIYHSLKLAESRHGEKSQIKLAINKRMESFELNKGHTIQSILERPFRKVILDHLVVNNELILEPGPVKSKVDEIIEGWIRKCRVVPDIPKEWYHQYRPLSYVFDKAFWGVMQPIEFLELFGMVSDLPDGKAASLLGISNEL
ncbi:hypothetical protein G9A89_016050 [Geosiphon pyriformis]|nr:hypothetical protein G9A89_016050 [Geosiphon pyriformis]